MLGYRVDIWFAMVGICAFLVGFIPGFYIPYLLLKKTKINTSVVILTCFIIGWYITINWQNNILSTNVLPESIYKAAPLIELPTIVLLEIVVVTIHILRSHGNKKGAKRSRK